MCSFFPALLAGALGATASLSVFAQTPASGEVVRGPFLSATVRAPKSNEAIAMKGIVVTVGKDAYICYDTDLMRVSMAWTGDYLEFGNTLNQIAWPPPPQVKGNPVFSTKAGPGWAKGETLADPREIKQGPLPKDWAHYKGLFVYNDQVVFSYTVGKVEVLELPGFEVVDGRPVFTRTFNIGPSREMMTLDICNFDSAPDTNADAPVVNAGDARYVTVGKTHRLAVGLLGGNREMRFDRGADDLRLQIPPHSGNLRLKLAISQVEDQAGLNSFADRLKSSTGAEDLEKYCKGGKARWTEKITTKGVAGKSEGDEAYVVDTITEPVDNPYRAKTFFGGFDFFKDGRAAICTFHGDVWVVSGIDDTLENLTWKRYATGLFQPLGLKIVKDQVYVLGRDQITRLKDLNKDGEADAYENFNNDTIVTANYHEFSLDLHTDPDGNFYFAKGAPWEPEVTSPHQGTILKVSRDGSKMEVVATGLRAPNGMTVGPKGEITVSDNQGHWMPSSKMNWVTKGGFYGMTPAAQRELKMSRGGTNFVANPSDPKARAEHKFKGWDGSSPMPEGYDRPMVWLPMNMDNSSGGQVFVTSKKWGPLNGQLLFMSYGKCTLFSVLPDKKGDTMQGAMVQFPLKFNSGVMRGRFNNKDGQLYVAGLQGWQTSATREGGFYRVRYTGKPVAMPIGFKATPKGVDLTFTTAVDPTTASDVDNYSIERWNYRWSGNYGSPEISVNDPSKNGHDKVEVKSAQVSNEGKTVSLELADMKPSDQIKIRLALDTSDGKPLDQEIYGTIYTLEDPKQ
ncbi:MAG: DUF6797 domain-containing protein [Verrucomicrobiales bacterium]